MIFRLFKQSQGRVHPAAETFAGAGSQGLIRKPVGSAQRHPLTRERKLTDRGDRRRRKPRRRAGSATEKIISFDCPSGWPGTRKNTFTR